MSTNGSQTGEPFLFVVTIKDTKEHKVFMKVSVFGSSQPKEGSMAYAEAQELGKLLAQRGHIVLTGGYMGTMEAVSRGAAEAGGHVIGVTCEDIERLAPAWCECVGQGRMAQENFDGALAGSHRRLRRGARPPWRTRHVDRNFFDMESNDYRFIAPEAVDPDRERMAERSRSALSITR